MQGTLIVKPVSAKLTYDAEIFGKMDCYCDIQLGGETFKTKVAHSQGKYPSWDETFTFNISHGDGSLEIQILDKNKISSDDYVGSATINLMDVFQRRNVSENFPVNRKGKDIGNIFIVLEFHPQDEKKGAKPTGYMGAQTSGQTSAQINCQTSGQTNCPTSGQTSDYTSGHTSGLMGAQHTSGPVNDQYTGTHFSTTGTH